MTGAAVVNLPDVIAFRLVHRVEATADQLARRAVCMARGHQPSWALAVACTTWTHGTRPPKRPRCERCRREVEP